MIESNTDMGIEGRSEMDEDDSMTDGSRGLIRTLAENAMPIGVTASIGIVGFVTTLIAVNNPGVPSIVPAVMGVSTVLFTLAAAEVVRPPVRTIVVLAGIMLSGYLAALALAQPMAEAVRADRRTTVISVRVPERSKVTSPAAAEGSSDVASARTEDPR